jgi:hypothetical protein
MEHGMVFEKETGKQFSGVLRANGSVAYVEGKTTRYAALSEFDELGLKWQPFGAPGDMIPPECREPIDSPRFLRDNR